MFLLKKLTHLLCIRFINFWLRLVLFMCSEFAWYLLVKLQTQK